ncbi:hypothetical protein OK349_02675 [Sphingomonas sp. BT-65]|uniref:hypothetical protein n=1 Tax=Sphingomonas sp. BT-65 TaxID=2989821 RepID=UPI00223608F2|nr:hypothetical protein [Sphingomonas sp. BT-65]MCW4460596.1 hypothetical protein [Sphingomonas sp. BT-65]
MADWLRRLIGPHAETTATDDRSPSVFTKDSNEFLEATAKDFYKSQTDLDESIWRSLPFFAAAFIFVATVIGQSATRLPKLATNFFEIVTHLLFLVSCLLCAWVLRWFYTLLKPREYEFPASFESLKSYATELENYHSSNGLSDESRDAAVTNDLREFLAEQYGTGASANLRHNAERLKARSKVLLFMLLAFLLAFLCHATIFIVERYRTASLERRTVSDEQQSNRAKAESSDKRHGSPRAKSGPAPKASQSSSR